MGYFLKFMVHPGFMMRKYRKKGLNKLAITVISQEEYQACQPSNSPVN